MRALTLVEAAVPILLGFFQAPLFTPENTFTEIVFDPYRIFDESLDGDLVESRNLFKHCPGP